MNISLEIKINSEIYSENIVLRTMEIPSNQYYCTLDKNEGYFIVHIKTKFQLSLNKEDLKFIFFDYLNNEIIREKIFKESGDIRNLIVGKALFETEAFDEQSDYFDIDKYEDKDNYILDLNNIAKT